eukprot:3614119-Pyramimonas_sp.AAC.1
MRAAWSRTRRSPTLTRSNRRYKLNGGTEFANPRPSRQNYTTATPLGWRGPRHGKSLPNLPVSNSSAMLGRAPTAPPLWSAATLDGSNHTTTVRAPPSP